MSATRPEINLHPANYQPASLSTRIYDVIVIGAGPAGEMTAQRCVRGGLTALLVECELVGGECPYWACVPSKALLRPSETIEAAGAVGGAREVASIGLENLAVKYGVGSTSIVDREGTWKRRDFFTKNWDDTAAIGLMKRAGVDIVRGFGRILGTKKVSVTSFGAADETELEARHAVVIATGSEPVMPDILGITEAKPWTPREAVSASHVPGSLIIVGAGPVGTELATAYRQLGSDVTLVTGTSRVLSKFEPEASKRVLEGLKKLGVGVVLATQVQSVKREGDTVIASLSNRAKVQATEILIASGRKVRTKGLNLEFLNLPGDGTALSVDDTMLVRDMHDGWLYAVGDANGVAPLTHIGKYQGKICGDSIVERAKDAMGETPSSVRSSKLSSKASRFATPQVTFTDPQVASVGLTFKAAGEAGMRVKEATTKMSGTGTFLHAESYDGWAQWVVEEDTGRLVGATFVGRNVADLLHGSTVAIVGRMTVEQLWHAIPSFPTMSETYTSLLEACGL